jgi:MYXO-CTERM domain-containing protein
MRIFQTPLNTTRHLLAGSAAILLFLSSGQMHAAGSEVSGFHLAQIVPEPGPFGLAALAAFGIFLLRRRRS